MRFSLNGKKNKCEGVINNGVKVGVFDPIFLNTQNKNETTFCLVIGTCIVKVTKKKQLQKQIKLFFNMI